MPFEMGVCANCESPLALIEVRRGRCPGCKEFFDPFEIGFAGDLHVKVERTVTYLDSD